MYYPEDVIAEVREGNDIVDVIGSYVRLTKKGSSYMGLCPFHREKTPSFSVNRDNQFYHCFGCGAGGNVIGFVMQYENVDFAESIKLLADRINYTLPEGNFTANDAYKKEVKDKLKELHKTAARFYYDQLQSEKGKKAVEYLDNRKVSTKIRNKFGLGYSPINKGALYAFLKEQGYDDELIFQSGLVYKRSNGEIADKFFNRLMFPIIDPYGSFIGFGGRVIGQGEPKYLNSPETPIFDKSRNLYNLNLAKKTRMRELILVEGYMDVISIYEAGFHNVVASLGTAFNDRHAATIKRFADSVILLFDSDSAGENAVLRAIPVLKHAGLNIKVLQVKDAKDPDEYIKKFGASAFGELLQTAVNQIIFRVNVLKKKYNLNIAEEKVQFLKEVINIISEIENDVEKDIYIKEISRISDVEIGAIKAELDKKNAVINLNYNVRKKKSQHNSALDNARNNVLCLLATKGYIYTRSKGIIKAEEFDDDFSIQFYNILCDLYDSGKPIIAADIANHFTDNESQAKASAVFMLRLPYEEEEEAVKAFNDCMLVIRKAYLDKQLDTQTDNKIINNVIDQLKHLNHTKFLN